MTQGISRKWRPSMGLVVGCTLLAVLCLPGLGLGLYYLLKPALGRMTAILLVGAGIVVVTFVIGLVLRRVLLRPVTALAHRAEAITRGDADALSPLPHYGTAELRDMGQAMLSMGATLRNREAGIRAYSEHVTHEFRSPLTSIVAAVELLAGPVSDDDRAGLLQTIETSTTRMQDLLDALRHLARARTPLGQGPTDFATVTEALKTRVSLPIRVEGTGDLPLDGEGLLAVLEQLAQNAENHGALSLTLHKAGETLQVIDDGPGVPPGDRPRIFDPFFTTRRDRGGNGMGLAIVRAMLEASGARIDLMDTPTGAGFEIRFSR